MMTFKNNCRNFLEIVIVVVIVISRCLKRQSTSLFTSAATIQRGMSKGLSREAQVRYLEYKRQK